MKEEIIRLSAAAARNEKPKRKLALGRTGTDGTAARDTMSTALGFGGAPGAGAGAVDASIIMAGIVGGGVPVATGTVPAWIGAGSGMLDAMETAS